MLRRAAWGTVAYRGLLRANVALKDLTRRPFSERLSPFEGDRRPAILHCCYHKVGTVWFLRVLRAVAAHFGMAFEVGEDHGRLRKMERHGAFDVFLDYGSHLRLEEIEDYVGSHMIRDPRDMAVSGYFYHLWTTETWANLPRAELRGMSYREYLNSVSREVGLLAEIREMSFWVHHMASWDYENPRMYEMRYEDIRRDERRIMREIFRHYGFSDPAVDTSCRIAERYTFSRMSGRKGASHLRSGRTGEWKEHFGEEHRRLFKELYPGVLSRLGYEKGDGW